MEQIVLINEAAQLINQASERAGAGFPDQAQARLEGLKDLLNKELVLDPADDAELEEKLEPSQG